MTGRAAGAALALLVWSLPAPALHGQARAATAWWGSAAVGAGFLSTAADLSSHVGATYQRGRSVFAARSTSILSVLGIIFTGFGASAETSAGDVGVLYGRATAPGAWHASVAAGAGVARITRDSSGVSTSVHRFTVPLEAQLGWRPTRFLGVAMMGFASVNGTRSFGGLAFGLQVGRLR